MKARSHLIHLTYLTCLTLFAAFSSLGQTPFNVTGITDRTTYNNSVSLTVVTEPGYTYALYLNGTNMSSGGSYTIRDPDFYLVQAFRTNITTSAVTNRYFRIIVIDTGRGDTEVGLPSHTPLIAIPSSSNEFAGGQLRLIVPAAFPAGYEIPVVAWAVSSQGKTLRANGRLEASGHPSIFLRRGAGSGFLAATNPAGALQYSPNLKGIPASKSIFIEGSTAWTTVSGPLSGNVLWAEDSRIFVSASAILTAGSTLTIGAGTIVRINPGVNITNNGIININGTLNEPVVFMPNSRSQYWGGFQMRSGQGQVNATWTIFSGSGAAPNWFSGGHHTEQALFDDNQSLTLTDCAQIFSAGQFGRNGGVITLTRFLVQGAVSAGEFSGASLRVNDSAFIEIPDDSSNFVNLDNDALYLDDGDHAFTNSLFGWTKDDGIDSGASGTGTIYYESCWFESIFHEGNSLSGFKNVYPHNCVYMDCGQGHEDGYDAPNGWVDNCLFLANKSGLRHGDNYSSMSQYGGLLTASNSILLFNHRDIFPYNWKSGAGWTNNWGQTDIHDNWLTKPDTNYPNNAVWNPAADGWRLAAFSTAPGDANVGVGMALRSPQLTAAQLTNGVPIRLSTFSTNFVSVDYAIESASSTLASGTLQFVPGEIVKYPRVTAAQLQNQTLLRLRLQNPVRAEITANPVAFYSVGLTQAPPQLIFPANSSWKYPNVAGAQSANWTNLTFNDSAWLSGPAQLGFSNNEENDEATLISNLNQITYYFRRTFNVDNPNIFASLSLELLRDDGGVIFINGVDIFRSPNLPQAPAVIGFNTATSAPNGENTIDRATTIAPLVAGQNIAAVEIHQQSATSSDVSFSLRLDGLPGPRLELQNFRGDWLLFWADPAFKLQQADTLAGPWTTLSTPSPVPVDLSGTTRFYRLIR